jgi:serine/threonine protein kinase
MKAYAGQTIGSLVLRHKIAEGGMGSIWAAEHVTLNREVAVKFLTKDPREDDDAVQRFALEARTVARISSPHVPQVFDHGVCEDGTPYIVMELVDGIDLKSWVGQHGQLSLSQAVRLVEQVCLAMSSAHQLGIVHRDIKPENLLLSGEGETFHVKLVDFGIAKSTALSLSAPSLTLAGTTMGTPSYMSPEQLMSARDVDERSDVWSLAVVVYWALTGSLPFAGETFAAMCVAINRAHFTPASELRPDLPSAVDQWFDKALSREVEGRFESADMMNRMMKVAGARPAEWTKAFAVVKAPSNLAPELSVESPVGGLSRTSRPFPIVDIRRRRQNAVYGVSGAALGLVVIAFFAFFPSRHTAPTGAKGGDFAVSTTAIDVPASRLESLARISEPSIPVEKLSDTPATVEPHAAAPSVAIHPAVPAAESAALPWQPAAPVADRAPARVEPHSGSLGARAGTIAAVVGPKAPASEPPGVSAVVSAKPKGPETLPSVANADVHPDAAAAPAPSSSATSSSWRPTDELGEP